MTIPVSTPLDQERKVDNVSVDPEMFGSDYVNADHMEKSPFTPASLPSTDTGPTGRSTSMTDAAAKLAEMPSPIREEDMTYEFYANLPWPEERRPYILKLFRKNSQRRFVYSIYIYLVANFAALLGMSMECIPFWLFMGTLISTLILLFVSFGLMTWDQLQMTREWHGLFKENNVIPPEIIHMSRGEKKVRLLTLNF